MRERLARSEEEWIALGRAAILDVLERHVACPWAEVEVRCAEPERGIGVDPMHLVTARDRLLRARKIEEMPPVATRGGRELSIYHLPVKYGDKRAVERTAMRKRLLQTRWIGWGVGSVRVPRGYIGEAGERVVRASLNDASLRDRYYPINPGFGEVGYLFDGPIQGGALDSGAWLNPPHGGVPGSLILAPIEVKNIREWLFPRMPQVHQLLYKAAMIQQARPEQEVLPILVGRERQYTTFKMAQDLGFFALNIHRQFMLPSTEVSAESVEEVRDGLGFRFLHVSEGPDDLLINILRSTIPPRARETAERWRTRGSLLVDHYTALRRTDLGKRQRSAALDRLREAAEDLPDHWGGW